MRRYGETPRSDVRYINRPGAYGVILAGKNLLVTEESNRFCEIQLPGGGIDPGESPLRALHREVMEETGWIIAVDRKLGAFQRYAYMPEYDISARKVCHIYLCRAIRPLCPPSEPHHRAVLIPVRQASERINNVGDQAFVRSLFGSRP